MNNIGKYRLVRKLAEGGMAEVFLAQVEGPGGFMKPVVVKRVLPELSRDRSFIAMFMSEAKLVAQLNHPNIVQVFDFGLHEGSYFLVMEYVDGFNLRALNQRTLAASAPIPFELAARMIAAACEGLAYAHAFSEHGKPLNLIHRDISPENLLVGTNGVVKVADFGIARVAGQQRMTLTGTVRGKLVYMAPEQMQGGAVDCRVDVFALGIVLYELICGRRPFEAKTEIEAMKAILTGTMTPAAAWRADMPPQLQQIIDTAMARSPDARYKNCSELQMALEHFIAVRGVLANTQTIGKLVGKLADPVSPSLTVLIPPSEQQTLHARVKAPVVLKPVILPSRKRLVLAVGTVVGVGALGLLALWPPRAGRELLVAAPPRRVPAEIVAQLALQPRSVEVFREEDYPIPPAPPAAPRHVVANKTGAKPHSKMVLAAVWVDAGSEPTLARAAKLTAIDEDPVLEVPRPVIKGRLTVDPSRGVIVHNDTSFQWNACELRLPFQKFFRFEKTAIESNDSDNIQLKNFEIDRREPDGHMKDGWAMIRCREGAAYLWWGPAVL